MEEKDFIESGILELYVLDALSPEERTEVEKFRSSSMLIAAELRRIEASMELFSLEHAVEPSAGLKAKIETEINFNLSTEFAPEVAAERISKIPLQSADTEFVLSAPGKKSDWSYYALAACLTLLLISSGSAFSLWSKLKATKADYADLLSKSSRYGNQVSYYKGEYNKSRELIDNPDFRKLPLLGTTAHKKSIAVVFWNKKKHIVMIDPNGLDITDAAHSYQLWAIAKGKPVDAGIFEARSDLTTLSQMNDIDDAQAFAVTLEPKGGSKSPTMSEMYVMSTI